MLLFISYFQVHFCSICLHLFTFLSFFFFCTSNESIMCFICMLLFFLVLSPLTHNPTSLWLILREERQDHSNCRENSSPFCLCCCVIGGGWGLGLVNLLFFYPPSHPYYFMGHPTRNQPPSQGPLQTHLPWRPWERVCSKPSEVLRYIYF